MNNENNQIWYTENLDVGSIFCSRKQKAGQHLEFEKVYKKGEYVYTPGEDANKIFFITDGRVKIGQYSDGGREITKAILDEGELFGELATQETSEKRRDYAIAMMPTSLCIMSKADMKDLMRENNAISHFFMNIFASRIVKMEKRLENLVFKDSKTRIIEFLLELVEEKGSRVGYEWVVRRFLTHQDIANLTATSRQTVTTILNELKKDALITFDRRRLLVRELDELKGMIG